LHLRGREREAPIRRVDDVPSVYRQNCEAARVCQQNTDTDESYDLPRTRLVERSVPNGDTDAVRRPSGGERRRTERADVEGAPATRGSLDRETRASVGGVISDRGMVVDSFTSQAIGLVVARIDRSARSSPRTR
jgi:hypothetical protein